jgi:serine/threonine-protein kinase|nr:protein kinase [Kofleriaceae bacterium]
MPEVFAGKYEIETILGEGGMGRVFAATHIKLGKVVAIKVLRPELAVHDDVVQRFLREARAASRLRSPHVCAVIDVDQLASGEPYLVMEMLRGCDLGALVKARGKLPVDVAVGYLLEASEALAEAHAHGMVHRDIKPANLFLAKTHTDSSIVKVLDFGIATRATGEIDSGLTRTSSVMGSPSYMSPEQLRSAKDVDVRSDIWSLGVTLYELISGARPFEAESFSALSIAIAVEPHLTLNQVPEALRQVVDRCLEKRPERRFQQVSDLATALAPFATEGQHSVQRVKHAASPAIDVTLPPTPSMSASKSPATTHSSAVGQSSAKTASPSRMGLLWIGGGVALVALLVGVVGAVSKDKAPTSPSSSSDATHGLTAATSPATSANESGAVSPRPASPPSQPPLPDDSIRLNGELENLQRQLSRAQALKDDALVAEISTEIKEHQRQLHALILHAVERERDAFLASGAAAAARALAETLESVGDPSATRVKELALSLERGQTLPGLAQSDRMFSEGEVAIITIVETLPDEQDLADAFAKVNAAEEQVQRALAIDVDSKELARLRDTEKTAHDGVRRIASGKLDTARKRYALEGQADQLLAVAFLTRIAGDVERARSLCDQYVALHVNTPLLPAGLDSDGDGVLLCVDDCPTAEGRHQKNGCPIHDADGDGIADEIDRCPSQPETFNGYQDSDGCPDRVQYCLSDEITSCFTSKQECVQQAALPRINGNPTCIVRGVNP